MEIISDCDNLRNTNKDILKKYYVTTNAFSILSNINLIKRMFKLIHLVAYLK
jgi:hypothetical protein